MEQKEYKGIAFEKDGHVAWVYLDRPDRLNAMNPEMWDSLIEVFSAINLDRELRCVILAGKGRIFSAGLDLASAANHPTFNFSKQTPQNRMDLLVTVKGWQDAMSIVEICRKPVIAAIHGKCIGGGLDLVSACDIRLASEDAVFSLREAAVAMVADLGSLQRLPLIIGQGKTRELAFTARDVKAQEALSLGLVNHIYPNQETLMQKALEMAKEIASQSPLAVQSSKEVLNYSRGKSIEDGMHYAVLRNSLIIPSDDIMEAFQAFMQKRKPKY